MEPMKTRHITYLPFLVLGLVLINSCKNGTNRPGSPQSITDADRIRTEIQGGWSLISATGEPEKWYFTDAPTGWYTRFSEDENQSGTWAIRDRDMYLDGSDPRAVQIDGAILKLGNYRLQRDTVVTRELEQRLSREILGTWVSDDSLMVYEFMANNYYQYRYTDDPSVPSDGDWRISGMKLVLDDNVSRADPIAIQSNRLQWGMMYFYREGERPELPPAASAAEGTLISGRAFSADLGRFGEVTVAPYQVQGDLRYQLAIKLLKDGSPVYTMPEFPGNRLGEFDGLRALAARDINGDGVNDLLVMADYLEDTGNRLEPHSVNAVYTNLGRSFRIDNTLTDRLSNSDDIRSIDDMVKAIRGERPAARTAANRTESSGSSNRSASRSTNYSKYRNDKSVCRIRVAAVKGAIDRERVAKLADLGIISYEATDNGFTYVYLGKYIGKETAYRILDRVKARGHGSAFVVVEQDFINAQQQDAPDYSTFQVASLKKLDLESFNALADSFRGDIYVTYNSGYYRLSMGLYQKQLYPYIEEEFRNMAARLGYGDGFSRIVN